MLMYLRTITLMFAMAGVVGLSWTADAQTIPPSGVGTTSASTLNQMFNTFQQQQLQDRAKNQNYPLPIDSANPMNTQMDQPIQPASGEVVLETRTPETMEALDWQQLPMFGSQLFRDPAQLSRHSIINEQYIIVPGDQIAVKIWGALDYQGIQTVDPQGNIFLPEIGPIPIAGKTAGGLNNQVNAYLRRVFTENVQVYTSQLSKQPVGVYLTGNVVSPGRFGGDQSSSLLSMLLHGDGIDPLSGSYRDIRIIRNGDVIHQIDLYNFLVDGDMPKFTFEEDDTIVVGPQMKTIAVAGDVRNAYRFEIKQGVTTGADVIEMIRPLPSVTHLTIVSHDRVKNRIDYISIEDFEGIRLRDGDKLTFNTDRLNKSIMVRVEGHNKGASRFAVPKGTRLGDMLDVISVNRQIARPESIYIRRQSVIKRQKRAIELSLDELQRSVLLSPVSSPNEASIRIQEAQLVDKFLLRARAVEPEGRVVVAGSPYRDDLVLEDKDEIIIPEQSDVVMISGEVRLPQTIMFRSKFSASDYASRAGGFTERGDLENIVVIRQSGETLMGSRTTITPGDQIMVLPKSDPKGLAIAKDIMEIIYRIAISSAVILRLL